MDADGWGTGFRDSSDGFEELVTSEPAAQVAAGASGAHRDLFVQIVAWAVVAVSAAVLVVLPRLLPAPTKPSTVAEMCRPIEQVILDARAAGSMKLTKEAHNELATAASTQDLAPGLLEAMSDAVDKKDVTALVGFCTTG